MNRRSFLARGAAALAGLAAACQAAPRPAFAETKPEPAGWPPRLWWISFGGRRHIESGEAYYRRTGVAIGHEAFQNVPLTNYESRWVFDG